MNPTDPLDTEYRDRTEDYRRIVHFFRRHHAELQPMRVMAGEVAELTELSGRFIQEHTAVVCPSCKMVCCANRHSYHEVADIIYLCALGEAVPAYEKGRKSSDPCQFMGERGCTMPRFLRPYRCNWYFCTPLLEHMQAVSAREYRRCMDVMTELGRKREELLSCYACIAGMKPYEALADPNGDDPVQTRGG